jgi:hypothetical protein
MMLLLPGPPAPVTPTAGPAATTATATPFVILFLVSAAGAFIWAHTDVESYFS